MFDFYKYTSYIPLILAGFALAIIITPLIIKLALKFGVCDQPNTVAHKNVLETNLHNKVMPRMGFVAVILPLLILSPFFISINFNTIIIAITIVILSILGILDDKYRLSAAPQLLVQIFCIALVILSGITIQEANNPLTDTFINFERGHFTLSLLGHSANFTILSIVVTFAWLLFITNAIAWVDGIDGVLNGTVAISLLIIFLVSIRQGSITSAVISAIFLGANLGFLPYNFAPAKIINGFGGSIYGYIIGILAIISQVKLSIAILVLLVPVLDVIWVISFRIKKYKPKNLIQLFKAANTPGKVHFHHRLLDAGLSTRKVAMTEYVLAACAGLIALLLSGLELTFVIISSVLLVLLIFILIDRIRRKELLKKKND